MNKNKELKNLEIVIGEIKKPQADIECNVTEDDVNLKVNTKPVKLKIGVSPKFIMDIIDKISRK